MIILSKLHEHISEAIKVIQKIEGKQEYTKEDAVKKVQNDIKGLAPHEIEKVGEIVEKKYLKAGSEGKYVYKSY